MQVAPVEISILKYFAAKARTEHTTSRRIFEERRGDAIEGWDLFARQDVQEPVRLAGALRVRQSDVQSLKLRLAPDDLRFGACHGIQFSDYVIAECAIQACLGASTGLRCTTPAGSA